jgi:hypothetical protein
MLSTTNFASLKCKSFYAGVYVKYVEPRLGSVFGSGVPGCDPADPDRQHWSNIFCAVLRIQIRIRIRIHMFLGLPDPDPLVRGMDPDPSIIMQK